MLSDVELEDMRQYATRHAYDYALPYVGDSEARNYANYYSATIADENTPVYWPGHSELYSKWYAEWYIPALSRV